MPIGVYIHVPFCLSKCPYCDFYSLTNGDEQLLDRYTEAVAASLQHWASLRPVVADTLYFGGGTPSLLGGKRIAQLISCARDAFSIPDTAEITTEANPADQLSPFFEGFVSAGGNRLSLGMQADSRQELQALGRRHTAQQTEQAVRDAQRAGIYNISLDMMLGIAGQTRQSVKAAVARCSALGATHVSAYLLKIEPNTPYAAHTPSLPNEDETVALYETAADALASAGYAQYEISNFATPHCESRHNLKYWNSDPYLGIGPSAHSFLDGKRFYYPRSLTAFLEGGVPLPEQEEPDALLPENSPQEYAMLRLRLTEGLTHKGFLQRFHTPIPHEWLRRADRLPPSLITVDASGIRLTRQGFLVSDAILAELLLD